MKFEIIIMDILAQLYLLRKKEKKKKKKTHGSAQTFILAHIDITVNFIY